MTDAHKAVTMTRNATTSRTRVPTVCLSDRK
ncbi:hypothetical protein CLV43_104375 [Umezawaea tangerina]|uniref:Uncharacterized protein n=1 Tax=Umezawaea tangerina TaxID=84725 RepID=A0A2T0TA58_9PSEU|nr:hypothetical protein CLV43_104375 [Umezawaea tangerina]